MIKGEDNSYGICTHRIGYHFVEKKMGIKFQKTKALLASNTYWFI